MKIRIISTPPGEAPEHVRQAWIGLEIPVPPRFARRRRGFTFGVLSGPKSRFGRLFAALLGRVNEEVGYTVESAVAIDLLAARSPEAAAWWRQNTPKFNKPGHFFMFAAGSCEELPETAGGARSIGVIKSNILVESSGTETDQQFCAAIESMILQTYRQRPDWLQFSAGARYVFGGRYFREFVCHAGSVSLMLMQRAKRDGGFTRAIVCRADYDAFEIRAGAESEHFSPDQLKAA